MWPLIKILYSLLLSRLNSILTILFGQHQHLILDLFIGLPFYRSSTTYTPMLPYKIMMAALPFDPLPGPIFGQIFMTTSSSQSLTLLCQLLFPTFGCRELNNGITTLCLPLLSVSLFHPMLCRK
jgi:hypothetical protein